MKLGDYKGLGIEKDDTAVTDEDVQNELKTLQERQAELVVKKKALLKKETQLFLISKDLLTVKHSKAEKLRTTL